MLRVIWFVVKGVAILYGLYVGLMLFILAGFGLAALQGESARQWEDLWRGKAEAEVVEVSARCEIREARARGTRGPAVFTRVPCERLKEERATRPADAYSIGPINEATITFRTSSGRAVTATTTTHALRLGEPVTVGQRVRISYDPAAPDRSPVKAQNLATFLMMTAGYLGIVAAGLGFLGYLGWIKAVGHERRRLRWLEEAQRRARQVPGGPQTGDTL